MSVVKYPIFVVLRIFQRISVCELIYNSLSDESDAPIPPDAMELYSGRLYQN